MLEDITAVQFIFSMVERKSLLMPRFMYVVGAAADGQAFSKMGLAWAGGVSLHLILNSGCGGACKRARHAEPLAAEDAEAGS